eukprot:scaffold30568_cov24-Phaeocystis_antarctica.AAC.1
MDDLIGQCRFLWPAKRWRHSSAPPAGSAPEGAAARSAGAPAVAAASGCCGCGCGWDQWRGASYRRSVLSYLVRVRVKGESVLSYLDTSGRRLRHVWGYTPPPGTQGCSLQRAGLQPPGKRVAAPIHGAQGCGLWPHELVR